MVVRFLLVAGLIAFGYLFFQPHQQPPPLRPLTWSDINFFATTDTHGWLLGHLNQPTYHGDWGDFVTFIDKAKKQAAARGQDVLVVDLGDRHDGNGLLDLSHPNGVNSTDIFVKQHYDVITLGNHELYQWEILILEYERLVPHYEGFVSSNVDIYLDGKWQPFAKKYREFTTPVNGYKVLLFGFMFDFQRNNNRTRVVPIKQVVDEGAWLTEVLNTTTPDIIVVVGHAPVLHVWPELFYLHAHIRRFHPDVPIQYFGGHSHIRDFSVFDQTATGMQAGRFCETVGFTLVNMLKEALPVDQRVHRSYLDFNRDLFAFHNGCWGQDGCADSDKGDEVKQMIKDTRTELGLDNVIGQVNRGNFYMDYVPVDDQKNLFRLLTSEVLPTLPGEGSRVIIINTGLVRYDLYKGPYTIDTQFIVLPFENTWVSVKLPRLVALAITEVLNEGDYIFGTENWNLRPPHQWQDNRGADFRYGLTSARLSKGYVTEDDFGNTGDDTPHKGVTHYPIPNVVQLILVGANDEEVEAVFYDFLIPNVKQALTRLYDQEYEITEYSNVYLGTLLSDFVGQGKLN